MKPYLLIHIPKTGGTSIQKQRDVFIECFGHSLARDIATLNDYYSFAVIRDPLTRFLSAFSYNKHNYIGKRKIREEMKRYKAPDHLILNWDNFSYKDDLTFACQSDFIFSEIGRLLVDDVLRFENLQKEWMTKINNSKLPRARSSVVHYKASSTVIEFVRYRYARDYHLLDY